MCKFCLLAKRISGRLEAMCRPCWRRLYVNRKKK
jgi:hypothetical protein